MNGHYASSPYGPDETEEMVDLNAYRGVRNPDSFDFHFNDIPSPGGIPSPGIASPRPAMPYRAGHNPRYSPPEYSPAGWLQPTPRSSDIPESWATTPQDSRSASPTLVSPWFQLSRGMDKA